MWKSGSFENEVFRSMEKTLVNNQVETKHGFSKLTKAADLLSMAAAIFSEAGMLQESKDIENILHDLIKDLK